MIYTCGKCRFIFECAENVEACPDCGKNAVQEATREEKDDYRKNRAILDKEERAGLWA